MSRVTLMIAIVSGIMSRIAIMIAIMSRIMSRIAIMRRIMSRVQLKTTSPNASCTTPSAGKKHVCNV